MTICIENKLLSQVDFVIKEKLRDLTLNNTSAMSYILNYAELDKIEDKINIILCYYGDKRKVIVGWGLYTNYHFKYQFPHKQYDPKEGTLFQVYVNRKSRKFGIGKMIVEEALKHCETLCVSTWSVSASSFYKKTIPENRIVII
jgi:GNAT superfamily N-acetyltransferase